MRNFMSFWSNSQPISKKFEMFNVKKGNIPTFLALNTNRTKISSSDISSTDDLMSSNCFSKNYREASTTTQHTFQLSCSHVAIKSCTNADAPVSLQICSIGSCNSEQTFFPGSLCSPATPYCICKC
jgi:hypothetical protein